MLIAFNFLEYLVSAIPILINSSLRKRIIISWLSSILLSVLNIITFWTLSISSILPSWSNWAILTGGSVSDICFSMCLFWPFRCLGPSWFRSLRLLNFTSLANRGPSFGKTLVVCWRVTSVDFLSLSPRDGPG